MNLTTVMNLTAEQGEAIVAASTAYTLCELLNSMDGSYATNKLPVNKGEAEKLGPWGHASKAATETLKIAFSEEVANRVSNAVWESGEYSDKRLCDFIGQALQEMALEVIEQGKKGPS